MRFFRALLLILTLIQVPSAFANGRAGGWICEAGWDCKVQGLVSAKTATPVKGDRIRVNPSAVPVDKVYGGEIVHYKSEYDFSIVKGFGRAGAAISPSNNEETFFGPPGIETPIQYLERMRMKDKLRQQKITLAGAVSLVKGTGSGIRRFELNLGLMGKYNRLTSAVHPGAGVSGVLGPLTYGAAFYNDESVVESTYATTRLVFKSRVETYSAGVFLSNFIFDYSYLRYVPENGDPYLKTTVSAFTGSLILNRFIFSASQRVANSERPAYDFQTQALEVKQDKVEYFGGAQLRLTSFLMANVFYNYYLLREVTLGATVFF